MEKFIPYEKLSKKEKRSRDLSRRNTWGPVSYTHLTLPTTNEV